MPLIIFEGPHLEKEKKRELARSFAEAASRATGLPAQIITTIFHENGPENVAPGGELLADKWARDGFVGT